MLSLPLLPELPGHEPGLPLHVDNDLANAGLDANGATATATITAVTAIASVIFVFIVSSIEQLYYKETLWQNLIVLPCDCKVRENHLR